ncbi:MAG TPA: 4-alpha-glucanotransferase [Candidatus Tumulicola sp.]|jgi:4-alpha-glucanotransferase
MDDSLDRLAELAGIQPAFHDYFGNEVRVGAETKREILAAMDYDVASETAIANALVELENAPWASPLPPVVFGRPNVRLAVLFRLPADETVAPAWEIDLEDGRSLQGTTSWQRAETIDRRTIGGRALERRKLAIDDPAPLGYHRLTIRAGAVVAACPLVVVPNACYVMPAMERGRVWALATQLYALRTRRDWGIGDFSSLSDFAQLAAAAGSGAIGLNPLHELHPASPSACSPYAPSSRLFLNALYIDVAAVADLAESPEARAKIESRDFAHELESLRAGSLVDYAGVARAKHAVLSLLFDSFCIKHLERPGDTRAAAFRRFVRDGDRALECLALYESLDEYFRTQPDPRYGWPQWPPEYRHPETPEVRRFAARRRDRVEYYLYLQWLADRQLAEAAANAARSGVGFYRDLAVGVALDGADAWSNRRAILAGVSLGAPPDGLNRDGQTWGLPPFSPHELRRRAYAPLAELLRTNMRHANVLRIDHVMALRRAFWVPCGRRANDGAYVTYDFDEMVGIVALESVRNRCAVVGEDLGTVPEGFRERMRDARALSSRLIYFERAWDGTFAPPQSYPRWAAASIGTHDLPPLAGWWLGEDSTAASAGEERQSARFALVDALELAGAIDPAGAGRLRADATAGGTRRVLGDLAEAVHRFLARTPSALAVVAIEDVLGESGAVNVPGTVDEHPNWRRRRSLPLEDLERDGRLFRIGAIMCDTQEAMVREAKG